MVQSVAITSPNRITKFDVHHDLNLGNINVLVHPGADPAMRARRNPTGPRKIRIERSPTGKDLS